MFRDIITHLPGPYNFDYVERLKICKLEFLELRRINCDVIILFKILHGIIHVDLWNNSIAVSNAVTKGNSYKNVKHKVRLDVRKYFYVNRVVNVWNCLNDNVVCSRTLHEFVHKLDSVNLSSFLKGEHIDSPHGALLVLQLLQINKLKWTELNCIYES